jgi:glyoxylase-like metal-dependent hydrolase (beta-lactamase superfamily II)
MLIDTAYPADYDKFIKRINEIGIGISKTKNLLLTHHHDDHAGFAARLAEQTGCRFIVHQDAVLPLSRGESQDIMKPVNFRVKMVFSLFSLFHKEIKFPPVVIAEKDFIVTGDENNLFKTLGIDGKIIHTPGHSSDSISVVLSDGNAFVGDVAMNFLNFTGIRN